MREYLKQLRKNKSLTQQDLEALVGIKPNYYCMIENGDRQADMSLSVMQKLAEAFDVSVEEILRMETKHKAEAAKKK